MSLQMMRSSLNASRPASLGRRARASVVRPAGKTIGGGEPEQRTGSKRESDVLEYLRTLPGWGPENGPFEGPWDPLSLTTTTTVEDVRRWRESEITHGRVAMLAALGFVVGEQLQDSKAFMNFDGGITGQAIYQFQQVRQGFWEPLLIFIGLAESYRTSIGWATPKGTGFNKLRPSEEYNMGDLGFDPLGLKPTNPDELRILQTKELNNGRLAMIAIAGFVAQELAEPGVEIFEHLFFNIQKEVIEEVDEIGKEVGLPADIPIPKL